MNNNFFKILLSSFFIFLPLFCFAQSGEQSLKPLNTQEYSAVMKDVQALVKTDRSEEISFVPKKTTPERIDRLFATPKFLKQPSMIKRHAFAFAGKSELLKFNKPSDVLNKFSLWFPDEIVAARVDGALISIDKEEYKFHGPYPSWSDEPAAFVALWHCMPQFAWIRPNLGPFLAFVRYESFDREWQPIGSNSSRFGNCIQMHSIDFNAMYVDGDANYAKMKEYQHQLAERVVPILNNKFSEFLTANRCRGTGPDDCALILGLWSDISPNSIELARVLKLLEPDIDLPGSLKEGTLPIDSGQYHSLSNAVHKEIFLRAKLLSLVNAQNQWSSTALASALHQLTSLWISECKASINCISGIQSGAYADPKDVFASAFIKNPKLHAAMLDEVNSLDATTSCYIFDHWFELSSSPSMGEQPLSVTYALQHALDQKVPKCGLDAESHGEVITVGALSWDWLKKDSSVKVQDLRKQFLSLLDQEHASTLTENMLSNFTHNGDYCFTRSEDEKDNPEWLAPLCKTWIQEPQKTPIQLINSHVGLNNNNQFLFKFSYFRMPPQAVNEKFEQEKWLMQLAQEFGGNAIEYMHALAADFRTRNIYVHDASLWQDPVNKSTILELNANSGADVRLLIKTGKVTEIETPSRFNQSGAIVRVSDLDHDGNPEIWRSRDFSECHRNTGDLERAVDCSAKIADMGEVRGKTLTYFTKSPPAKNAVVFTQSTLASSAANDTLFEPPEKNQKCNNLLIGKTLSSLLPIDFGGDKNNIKRGAYGDVIDLVCQTHPLHPEQVIVSLLYYLRDDQGNYLDENSSEYTKGFALAVIDTNLQKVHRIIKKPVQEDALTRVDQGSLHIDTSNYDPTKEAREIRVIMDISWCPRSLNCTGTSLSLWFEDGEFKVYNTDLVGGDPG